MKTHTHTRSINKEKQQQIQQYIPMHTKKNLKEKQHKKYTHIPPYHSYDNNPTRTLVEPIHKFDKRKTCTGLERRRNGTGRISKTI